MNINDVCFTEDEIETIRHCIKCHRKKCEEQLDLFKSMKGYDYLKDIDFLEFKIKKLTHLYLELGS